METKLSSFAGHFSGDDETVAPGRDRGFASRLLSLPGPSAALLFLAFLVLLGLVAPLIPNLNPNQVHLSNVLDGPSWGHWLGYDNIGRDILSRLIYASRVSLAAAAVAVLVALILGLPLGLISGYFGGWLDLAISRAVDALLSFPPLLLAIVTVSVLRPGLISAMIAIGIVNTPTFYRVVRSAVFDLRNETYIEAAIVSGSSILRIVVRHVLANIRGVLLVQIALTMSSAIIVEASLSFIGLGVQLPQASWGSMLRQASSYIGNAPLTFVLSPAATIVVVVLSFNTLADGLRIALGARSGAKR
jgi:peptide/nickel transport system permease protein